MLIQKYEYTENGYKMYELTKALGALSSCNHKQVGCVITDGDTVLSVGYNRVKLCNNQCNKSCEVIHAERAALMEGIIGIGSTAYVNLFPCIDCQTALFRAGVTRIVVFGEQGTKPLSVYYQDIYNIEMLPDLPALLSKRNGDRSTRQIVQGEAAELITAISNYDARDDRPESQGQLLGDIYGEIIDVELQLKNLRLTLPPDKSGQRSFHKWNKLIAKFKHEFFREDTLNKGPSS